MNAKHAAGAADPKTDWHSRPAEDAATSLGTDTARGLSEAEALSRLQHYGPNALGEAKRASLMAILLHQFNSHMVGLLVVATIVAGQSAQLRLPPDLVRSYLTENIRFRLGDNEYKGMRTYLEYAAALEPALEIK